MQMQCRCIRRHMHFGLDPLYPGEWHSLFRPGTISIPTADLRGAIASFRDIKLPFRVTASPTSSLSKFVKAGENYWGCSLLGWRLVLKPFVQTRATQQGFFNYWRKLKNLSLQTRCNGKVRLRLWLGAILEIQLFWQRRSRTALNKNVAGESLRWRRDS